MKTAQGEVLQGLYGVGQHGQPPPQVARQIGSGGERPETWLARLPESVTVAFDMRVEISLDTVATSAALDAST